MNTKHVFSYPRMRCLMMNWRIERETSDSAFIVDMHITTLLMYIYGSSCYISIYICAKSSSQHCSVLMCSQSHVIVSTIAQRLEQLTIRARLNCAERYIAIDTSLALPEIIYPIQYTYSTTKRLVKSSCDCDITLNRIRRAIVYYRSLHDSEITTN